MGDVNDVKCLSNRLSRTSLGGKRGRHDLVTVPRLAQTFNTECRGRTANHLIFTLLWLIGGFSVCLQFLYLLQLLVTISALRLSFAQQAWADSSVRFRSEPDEPLMIVVFYILFPRGEPFIYLCRSSPIILSIDDATASDDGKREK